MAYRREGDGVAELTVSLTSDLQRVTVHLGDILRICLAEIPTTGYLWSRVGPLPPELDEEGVEFRSSSNAVGGGGQRCFTYACRQYFVGDLVFELRRPWLPTEVEKAVRVKITCTR